MKKFLFLLGLFFVCACKTFAQYTDDEIMSKTWEFKYPTKIYRCSSLIGENADSVNFQLADKGFQFRVVNVLEDAVVIKFLKWKVTVVSGNQLSGKSEPNVILNDAFYMEDFRTNFLKGDSAKNIKLFKLPRKDFDLRTVQRLESNQFTVGAISLPIKLRFARKANNGTYKAYSSFTGNISIGLSFGLKHNYNRKFSLNYLGGFSLSSIPVSGETTQQFVENETNVSAITWHLGILTEIDNFQIGVFSGVDYLSGKINQFWDYRRRPWLGIGIGFSFFNAKNTTDTQ